MTDTNSKYVRVGTIVKNKDKDGKEYRQLILDKTFLDNAKELIQLAFLDKNGNRRFSLYPPFEGAPDYIEANVVVKRT